MQTIFVTGGCGFIGSNFILYWAKKYPNSHIINLDNLTYAANPANLNELDPSVKYTFLKDNIGHTTMAKKVLSHYQPDLIVNFAAESHVDRSIDSTGPFVQTNVKGTCNFLDGVRHYLERYNKPEFRLLHVSTDEVYGSLNANDPPFTELHQYAPNSPYSASKAASDHFVRAYHRTHGVPAIISNCSNNYGPRQHKEKFIPTVIRNALNNSSIPVYGNGRNVRDWLWVDDHCRALETLALRGVPGESYCIGGGEELANIELAKKILAVMKKPESLINYVTDRAGHDFRYAIDSSKIGKLGWNPSTSFDDGLAQTVEWYLQNLDRLQ